MKSELVPDLAILGCRPGDSWDDVKSAYRALVRRLHRELIEKKSGANERLARVNAAYDRLKAGAGDTAQARPRPEPRPSDARPDAETTARMQAELETRRFGLRFDAGRDPISGAYGDPRRRTGARHALPVLAHVVEASVRNGCLELTVSDAPAAGDNILVVPEIQVAADGSLRIGQNLTVLEFRLAQSADTVRLDAAHLPFRLPAGLRDVVVTAAAPLRAAA